MKYDPIAFENAYRRAWEELNKQEGKVAALPSTLPPGAGMRSPEAQALLEALFARGPLTRKEMAEATDLGERRVERALGRLIDTHLVSAQANAKTNHARSIAYALTLRGQDVVAKGHADEAAA